MKPFRGIGRAVVMFATLAIIAGVACGAKPKLAIGGGVPTVIDYAKLEVTTVCFQTASNLQYPQAVDAAFAGAQFAPRPTDTIVAWDIETGLPFQVPIMQWRGQQYVDGINWLSQFPPATRAALPGKIIWDYSTLGYGDNAQMRNELDFRIMASGSMGFDGRGPGVYNIIEDPALDRPGTPQRAALLRWTTEAVQAYVWGGQLHGYESVAFMTNQYHWAPQIAGTGERNFVTVPNESLSAQLDAMVVARPTWICFWNAWNQFNGTPCEVNDPRSVANVLGVLHAMRKSAGYADLSHLPPPLLNQPPAPAPADYGRFDVGEVYILNSNGVRFEPGDDFPQWGSIDFRTRLPDGAIVARQAGQTTPPYIYYRWALSAVPVGLATLEAVIRDAAGRRIATVEQPVKITK